MLRRPISNLVALSATVHRLPSVPRLFFRPASDSATPVAQPCKAPAAPGIRPPPDRRDRLLRHTSYNKVDEWEIVFNKQGKEVSRKYWVTGTRMNVHERLLESVVEPEMPVAPPRTDLNLTGAQQTRMLGLLDAWGHRWLRRLENVRQKMVAERSADPNVVYSQFETAHQDDEIDILKKEMREKGWEVDDVDNKMMPNAETQAELEEAWRQGLAAGSKKAQEY